MVFILLQRIVVAENGTKENNRDSHHHKLSELFYWTNWSRIEVVNKKIFTIFFRSSFLLQIDIWQESSFNGNRFSIEIEKYLTLLLLCYCTGFFSVCFCLFLSSIYRVFYSISPSSVCLSLHSPIYLRFCLLLYYSFLSVFVSFFLVCIYHPFFCPCCSVTALDFSLCISVSFFLLSIVLSTLYLLFCVFLSLSFFYLSSFLFIALSLLSQCVCVESSCVCINF